jgi:hypothetical protein
MAHGENWEAWTRAMAQELGRLDCRPGSDEERLFDHTNCLDLVTLWDELHRGTGRMREEYAYLQRYGYIAYWIWMEECDPFCGVPWAFYLDGEPTIPDRCVFPAYQAEAVLQCLTRLPDACGVHQVWTALTALQSQQGGEGGDPTPTLPH